ncbi:hypothetical protein HX878_22205 [Pseudomonas veronii]|uniref:hypothetical protein n=1 Tax=Pseudomonas veronii TaxID=76761 RepID=UPI0015A012D2|nr:hypothetical protein [Pseudomonas veronii]NWD57440.1 hypothetical protein [Pseudomonas veronii]
MPTQRPPIISDENQDDIERTLDELLNGVANGTIAPVAVKSGLLHLIASIDNGEPNQIATFSRDSNKYTSILSDQDIK